MFKRLNMFVFQNNLYHIDLNSHIFNILKQKYSIKIVIANNLQYTYKKRSS